MQIPGSNDAGKDSPVLASLRDGVGIIALNRPRKHNAIDEATRCALGRALQWANSDDAVRVIVLRGEGRSFCSGRDRTNFLDKGEHASHRSMIAIAQQLRLEQVALNKPSICAMQGYVMGGGAELALGCDMRIVASDLHYSFPEVGFGVVADTGASHLLTQLVGPARAKWLLLSGQSIGADEAVSWGLAEWSVPPEMLEVRALELAATLAARPLNASQRQKALVDDYAGGGLRDALMREMNAQLELFEGAEFGALQSKR